MKVFLFDTPVVLFLWRQWQVPTDRRWGEPQNQCENSRGEDKVYAPAGNGTPVVQPVYSQSL